MDLALTGSAKPWAFDMDISVLCSDPLHPVVNHLRRWDSEMSPRGHRVRIDHRKSDLPGGDVLFLVSCGELIGKSDRQKYKATLVLHASDLPKGRGWSPYVWAILAGASQITVSLLEASEPVDSGAIWLKTQFTLEGHELLPEINAKLFEAELSLMTKAVEQFESIQPNPQLGDPGAYMAKRSPADSRIDPNKSVAEQFDLLRVADSARFPAFFDFRGQRYVIRIEKDMNAK